MATNEIKMGINLRQNKNIKNSGYGKYYPEVDTQETLTLKGFAKHMSDHGSIYSLDLIEGVLKKITQCLPELISQGVPIRLDPLGTFLPTCTVDKPLNDIIDTQEVMVDGKKKKVTTLKPVATAVAEWKAQNGQGGSGSNTGEGSQSGSEGGNTQNGSQNQSTGFALTINKSGTGSASVTHNGNAVTSGATLNEDDEVEISITPAEGKVPTASVNGSSIELTENDGVYTGSFAMPGQASTLVINTGSTGGSGGDGGDGLTND